MEMSSSNVGNSRGDNPKWIKIAVCLGLLLGLLTTILIAVTLAQVNKDDSDNILDSPAVGGSSSLNDEDRISSLYKGFFRSPDEQKEYIKVFKNAKELPVNVSSTDEPEVGYFTDVSECSPGLKCSVSRTWNWTADIFNVDYNGCCNSHTQFLTPTYWQDVKGKFQLLAQFDTKKQYVQNEVCKQLPDCTVCRCSQLQSIVSLVYNNTGDYAIGQFYVPGCCKCFNS